MNPIPEFPGYFATEDGRVYSERSGRFLSSTYNQKGYQKLGLRQNGETVTQEVHRLIAAAFLGPANGLNVLHGENGQDDNSVSNLRYGTQYENLRDMRRDWSAGSGYTGEELEKSLVVDIRIALADEVDTHIIADWYKVPESAVWAIALLEHGL